MALDGWERMRAASGAVLGACAANCSFCLRRGFGWEGWAVGSVCGQPHWVGASRAGLSRLGGSRCTCIHGQAVVSEPRRGDGISRVGVVYDRRARMGRGGLSERAYWVNGRSAGEDQERVALHETIPT